MATTCPVCFNCNLADSQCLNFGECLTGSGRCSCPNGFDENGCSKPLCGSLQPSGNERRPPRPANATSCQCDDGWKGINCNVCNTDKVCDKFLPGNVTGICYNNMVPIEKNNVQCDVTNKGINEKLSGRKPQLTMSCQKEKNMCDFQFWIAEKQSFFCQLSECNYRLFTMGSVNATSSQCKKAKCACVPGTELCGQTGSIDLTEWFVSPDGPQGDSTFECEEPKVPGGDRVCSFSEKNMNSLISLGFGDAKIFLNCADSGECTHPSRLPGYESPSTSAPLSTVAIVFIALGGLAILAAAAFGIWWIKKTQNQGMDAAAPLADDEARREQEANLMAHHTPCTLTFHNVSYVIEQHNPVIKKRLSKTQKKYRSASTEKPSAAETSGPAPTRLEEGAGRKDTNAPLTILQNIQGMVKEGQVMAIMGGSGAGKTTFLDILARKNKRGVVSGEIRVNGQIMGLEEYRSIIGYVDQEDTLMDTLTVYETILYSALLRLPRKMTLANKKLRVHETMEELGILKIADRFIGSSEKRGISGGEKRRVSIACELVTSPSILFVDEPTSGLDAYNAYNVVECLVSLARNYKRTVIMTIHQPRSNIYALFDQLLLLAKGKVIYSGPAQDEAIQHFKSMGYECPLGFNLADYLVDLTMHAIKVDTEEVTPLIVEPDKLSPTRSLNRLEEFIVSPSPSRLSIQHQQEEVLFTPKLGDMSLSHIPSLYETEAISQDVSLAADSQNELLAGIAEPLKSTAKLDGLVQKYYTSSVSVRINRFIQEQQSAGNPGNLPVRLTSHRATWWTQIKLLSGRNLKNLIRNPGLLRAQYLITFFVAILIGSLYWKVKNDIGGFQNRLGLFYFSCIFLGFTCIASIYTFSSERLIFIRERANRYYSPFTYFLSKILFDIIPLRVIPPLIFGLICYHMVGLRFDSVEYFIKFLLTLVFFNMTAASVCLFISIVFRDVSVATFVALLVMLFQMLFGGLLVNKKSIPISLGWLFNLSFFNFAFEALAVNEANGLTLYQKDFGLNIDIPGAAVLSIFGLDVTAFWTDIGRLAITCTSFIILSFVWLYYFVKEKR